MHFRYLALPVLALAVSQPAAAQEEPLVLEPSTPWQLEYGEMSCSLSRSFGGPGETVVLQMAKFSPGEQLNFTVVSPDFSLAEDEFQYRVLPDDEARLAKVTLSGSSAENAAIRFSETLRTNANQSDGGASGGTVGPERLLLIEGIGIAGAFSDDFILLTGPLLQPSEATDTCLADLLESLALDFSAVASAVQPAERMEFRRWSRQIVEAYPRDMVRREVGAEVEVLVAIDTAGRVSRCKANGPEDYPQFGQAACRSMLEHARYEPARNANGEPVVSIDSMTLYYRVY